MTMPLVGPISLLDINTELGITPAASPVTLGDAAVRTLSGDTVGDVRMSDLYGKSVGTPSGFKVYMGLSATVNIAVAGVQTLPSFYLGALPYAFDLDAQGTFQYWASPVALGAVKFYDTESFFTGGWDGAASNLMTTFGPKIMLIDGINYYVYRTDYPNLGYCMWEARLDAHPPY